MISFNELKDAIKRKDREIGKWLYEREHIKKWGYRPIKTRRYAKKTKTTRTRNI